MKYSANQKTQILREKFNNRFNILLSWEDSHVLRRASLTLRKWYKNECNHYIFEKDGKTYKEVQTDKSSYTYQIKNMEKGALKRIKETCSKYDIKYFIQGDCRGTSLYISNKSISGENYSTEGLGYEL